LKEIGAKMRRLGVAKDKRGMMKAEMMIDGDGHHALTMKQELPLSY